MIPRGTELALPLPITWSGHLLRGLSDKKRLTQRRKARREERDMTENEIAKEVVDAALSVQRTLGPGLLESVYEAALAFELS